MFKLRRYVFEYSVNTSYLAAAPVKNQKQYLHYSVTVLGINGEMVTNDTKFKSVPIQNMILDDRV